MHFFLHRCLATEFLYLVGNFSYCAVQQRQRVSALGSEVVSGFAEGQSVLACLLMAIVIVPSRFLFWILYDGCCLGGADKYYPSILTPLVCPCILGWPCNVPFIHLQSYAFLITLRLFLMHVFLHRCLATEFPYLVRNFSYCARHSILWRSRQYYSNKGLQELASNVYLVIRKCNRCLRIY